MEQYIWLSAYNQPHFINMLVKSLIPFPIYDMYIRRKIFNNSPFPLPRVISCLWNTRKCRSGSVLYDLVGLGINKLPWAHSGRVEAMVSCRPSGHTILTHIYFEKKSDCNGINGLKSRPHRYMHTFLLGRTHIFVQYLCSIFLYKIQFLETKL